jgi:hypothetical protein
VSEIAQRVWREPAAALGLITSIVLAIIVIVSGNDWDVAAFAGVIAPLASSLGIRELVTPVVHHQQEATVTETMPETQPYEPEPGGTPDEPGYDTPTTDPDPYQPDQPDPYEQPTDPERGAPPQAPPDYQPPDVPPSQQMTPEDEMKGMAGREPGDRFT